MPELLRVAQAESQLIQQELGFVILLSIAALVAVVIRRIRIPYTVALVIVGLGLTFFPNFLGLDVGSDLILALLVPPLIFEATLQIKWERLRYDLVPILSLAIIGTLVGTFIVGEIVTIVLDVPLAAALAFGALISATDPVAVIAFFRSLGVSKRLSVLVEGESLFNDGVAIVVFNLAIAAAMGEQLGGPSAILLEFLRVAIGGLAVGAVLGYVVSTVVLKNVDDHLIETATTLALAYGAFVVTENFHLSGILAVVAAGLMVGNVGTQNTSPTTQITLDNFWEFLAFVVNSIIFLLIGLEIEIGQLLPNLFPIVVAVIAILLSRTVIVYGLTGLYSRFTPNRGIPWDFRHVMLWGGLRGAISLALALTLTAENVGAGVASELRVMTFGVVLFTLLVQGSTIERLIRSMGLSDRPAPVLDQQRRQAKLYAKHAASQELVRLRQEGILFADLEAAMNARYADEIEATRADLHEHLRAYPELEREMVIQARRDALRAERRAVADAARRGLISDEVEHALIIEADERLAALDRIGDTSAEIERPVDGSSEG